MGLSFRGIIKLLKHNVYKTSMIRKPHKIHENLNPTKINNYVVQH